MNNGGRTEHARGIPICPQDANNALAFFTRAPPDKDPSSSREGPPRHRVFRINRSNMEVSKKRGPIRGVTLLIL